ncbi:S8 family serine peptidase [Myxococcus stipitatus]|uniref:S8 family serine peptidase n=1 Tax=Myxococcus stipitatus TaxID=83455 RepID=UPI001F1DE3FD|nr:S8 family serine peptidase [Myxococcus stipitatus]MCE9669148.1 S8 family serine peptidase [Myxococcus stipitatus]
MTVTRKPLSLPSTPRTSETSRSEKPSASTGRVVGRPGNTNGDGFESSKAARPSNFIDRPTGHRPDPNAPVLPATAFAFGSKKVSVGPRDASTPVTLSASATPNAAVKDLQTVTSTVSFDQDVALDSLKLNLDLPHTYKGDLKVTLTSPSGKSAVVHDRTGGAADDVKGTFDLSTTFQGEKSKGTWTLTVEDKARADTGTLKSWGLEATGKAPGTDPVDPKPPRPTGDPVIAVFDGGVDYKHSDLDSAMWVNEGEIAGDGKDNDGNGIADDIHGFNVGFNSGDVMKGDGTDHGTHVAGIIAAEDNGQGNTGIAAGKAKIMSIGGLYDGADLLTNFERGVDYIVHMKQERGVNVRAMNASFGDEYRDAASQARWKAAVQKLADADILLVAATANGYGSNMNNVADMPANLDLPNVITVASMDKNNDKLARFSSHGDKVVELAAVGEDVLSTVPGGKWEKMSGTSMATPTVAGAAALMFAANPDLTAAQVRDLLVKTVEVDPDLKGKVSTSGKLDIKAAVKAAEEFVATPATVATR